MNKENVSPRKRRKRSDNKERAKRSRDRITNYCNNLRQLLDLPTESTKQEVLRRTVAYVSDKKSEENFPALRIIKLPDKSIPDRDISNEILKLLLWCADNIEKAMYVPEINLVRGNVEANFTPPLNCGDMNPLYRETFARLERKIESMLPKQEEFSHVLSIIFACNYANKFDLSQSWVSY